MAVQLPDLRARIRIDDSELAKVHGTASRTGKRMGTAFKVGAAVAGVALLKVGKDSLAAFGESQKVMAQTEAVLKSTGGTANVTADDIEKMSGKLQDLSGVEDEVIQEGQNMLLTFTNIQNRAGKGNKIFDRSTKALLNLSTAMGSEPKKAAIQLGKALNDPIKGVSALSRVGVTFTDKQKGVIKSLVEGGDVAGAQKIILRELTKEFGGSAKAAGDTRTASERLNLRFGELQEKIGEKLAPALQTLADIGIKVIDFIERNAKVLLPLAAAIGTVVVAVKVWTAASKVLNFVLAANPIGLVIVALAALVAGFIVAWKKSERFRDVVKGVFEKVLGTVQWVVDKILAVFEWIVRGAATAFGWVPGLGPKLKTAAKKFEKFRDDVNAALGGIKDRKVEIEVVPPDFIGPLKPNQRRALGPLPKKAAGGPVASGRPYIVGEQGRELFVPRQSGTIVPNNQLGSRTLNVTIITNEGMTDPAFVRRISRQLGREIDLIERAG